MNRFHSKNGGHFQKRGVALPKKRVALPKKGSGTSKKGEWHSQKRGALPKSTDFSGLCVTRQKSSEKQTKSDRFLKFFRKIKITIYIHIVS